VNNYVLLTVDYINTLSLYKHWKEGIRQRRRPKQTWLYCVKNDMESLGLSQKDAQFRNKWRRRIKGATGSQAHMEKWPLKLSMCVCVSVCVSI